MNLRIINNDKGFAALIALILVGMLTLIGLAALSTSDDEIHITGNSLQETKAFYAAEAGLEMAAAKLHYLSDSIGTLSSYMPTGNQEINECSFEFETSDNGPAELRVLENGTLAGLHAQVKSYRMISIGISSNDNSKVELSQSFERALVPIFQFAVFYDNDLEMAPGPDMNLIGRVHTNKDLWLHAGAKLSMDSYVTAAGHIFHGQKGGGAEMGGDVFIKDGSGNYVNMKEGSDWLESTDAHWYDSSVARWNGRVQDSTHGQESLNLPISGAAYDPHKLIERESGNPDSYETKATIKFVNGQAFKKIGSVWNNVTGDMIAKGIINEVENKFYDGRENTWVDVTELDIKALYDAGYAPENGVIYFSDNSGDFPALRIRNAAKLEGGLTIASENPVYTYGDFNSDEKKPASILGDAVTFLSQDFDDTKSNMDKNQRHAKETVVNASIITGNVETTGSNYNGGFENLPRFLETWSGKRFTWKGSMVNLWYSKQANGDWSGSYYTPPVRDWYYDTDLDDPTKLPPETPVFRIFRRTGWSMKDVSHAYDEYSNMSSEYLGTF